METAYHMVQTDNDALQSRLHTLEDELKTVKRELQEARDMLTEEHDIEPGRSRTDSVSASGRQYVFNGCCRYVHTYILTLKGLRSIYVVILSLH